MFLSHLKTIQTWKHAI